MSRAKLDTFQLRFPRELKSDAAVAALSSFTGVPHSARIVLDLSAASDGIAHHLAVTPAHRDSISASLRAAIPSLRLTPTDPLPNGGHRGLLQLTPFVASLRAADLDSIAASLLASLFPLRKGELIRVRWNLRSAPRPGPGISGDNELRGGRLKALRAKLSLPGMNAYGELSMIAASRGRRNQLMQRVASVLRSLGTPYGRLIMDPIWYGHLTRLLFLRGQYMNCEELAAVTGWPVGSPDLPGLDLGAAKRLVPSRGLSRHGRVLGVSDFEGVTRPVALSPAASTKGLYILGPTGTGKTNLLKHLILSDLEQDRGLLAIETNGDLITDVMDAMPASRRHQVIVIDPTDKDFAFGFNPLASSADPSLVADQVTGLFQRIWSSSWGPRVSMLVHMSVLTLARRPGSTLLDLVRLFVDASFREKVLADVDDPVGLGPDWQWFESLSSAEQAAVISPLTNKVRSFTSRPAIRAIVGQASPPLTMRQIVEQQKAVLVRLPKGLIGAETAQLLGCLILTALWQAMAERAAMPASRRRPFSLYCDEVQDMAAAPIPWAEMFAQGRKYGCCLTVANQNLEQLPKELREVILANARSKAVFALSASDARVMERIFEPALTAADLQALDAYSVAAIVALEDGSTARPVTLRTPKPPQPLGSFVEVREASRQRYARPRAEVEEQLRSAATGRRKSGGAAPVGRKKRTAP
jgi:hypothetical protein